MPLISVIIPLYNVEKYLKKCIESVLSQTYIELEVILIDDGSNDASGKICDAYMRKDSRVQVIHKKNEGVSAARNIGLTCSKGEYIIFVDADDWLESDMIMYLYRGMQSAKAQVSICGYYLVQEEKKKPVCLVDKDTILMKQQILLELSQGIRIKNYVYNQLIERTLLQGISFPEGCIFEDIMTTYHWLERADRVLILKEAKYNYFQRTGSLSRKKSLKTNIERCNAHAARYQDLTLRHPQLGDALLYQFFLAYRKLAREGTFGKKEKVLLREQIEGYLLLLDKLDDCKILEKIEAKELFLLKKYRGGTYLTLLVYEAIRIFNNKVNKKMERK